MQEAAQRDEEIAAWLLEADQRRRLDVRRSLERVFDREVEGPMLDALWQLYSADTYRTLVNDLGYSREEYQACLAGTTVRLLGEDLALLDAVTSSSS